MANKQTTNKELGNTENKVGFDFILGNVFRGTVLFSLIFLPDIRLKRYVCSEYTYF
jgi:hypothetical protein